MTLTGKITQVIGPVVDVAFDGEENDISDFGSAQAKVMDLDN